MSKGWLRESFLESSPVVGETTATISRIEVDLRASKYVGKRNLADFVNFELSPKYVALADVVMPEYVEAAYLAFCRYFESLREASYDDCESVKLTLPENLLKVKVNRDCRQRAGYVYGLGLMQACINIKGTSNVDRFIEMKNVSEVLILASTWSRQVHGV